MKISNNKGIGLIELLVVVAVMAISVPIVSRIYIYGIQSFSTYNKYMEQHTKVADVTRRIRADIEEAAAYKVIYEPSESPAVNILTAWIPDGDGDPETFTIKTWRLESGRLLFKSCTGDFDDGRQEALEGTGFNTVLEGLETDAVNKPSSSEKYMPTRFEKLGNKLLLSIKPVETNTSVNRNRNVTKPIITEFSVQYKELVT